MFLRLSPSFSLLLVAIAFAVPVGATIDHSPQWGANYSTLTYNLVDLELPEERAMFDAPADSPLVRLGNIQSRPVYHEGFPTTFSFSPLTKGPFAPDNQDLFFAAPDASLGFEFEGLRFPADSMWTAPNEGNDGGFTANLFTMPFLVRHFHFDNSLSDETTGYPFLDPDVEKVVVLIHGWNPSSAADSFSYPEFTALRDALKAKLAGTGWSLVLYHWEADADTGSLVQFDEAPIEAAHNAHKHGQHLGELLATEYPHLKSVHFIAHSAGSWCARSAARYLMFNGPLPKLQVTLVDPFMPAEHPAPIIHSGLGKDVMSLLDETLGNSGRLWMLENYYADDFESNWATNQIFDWRAPFINKRIDWKTSQGIKVYNSHDGPTLFYADSVYGADGLQHPQNASPLGIDRLQNFRSPDNVVYDGWYHSLFRNEPVILPEGQPTDTGTEVGGSFELSVTPRTRNSALPYGFTYQWFKNGDLIPGANAETYSTNSATVDMTGMYRVEVTNEAGTTRSEYAEVTVTNLPRILVHPLQNLTVPEGQGFPLSVTAAGPAPLSYRWQISTDLGLTWSSIFDAGIYTGADTPTLHVSAVDVEMDDTWYRVRVTNNDGHVDSETSQLNVPIAQPYTRWQWAGLDGNILGFTDYLVDADGSVWLAGGQADPNNLAHRGPAIWQLDKDTGQILWDLPLPEDSDPWGANNIALDSNGDPIVAGIGFVPIEGGSLQIIWIAKYSRTTHQRIWRIETPMEDGLMAYQGECVQAVDINGDVFVASTSLKDGYILRGYVIKVDGGTGAIQWRRHFDETSSVGTIACTQQGDVVFISGGFGGPPYVDLVTKLAGADGHTIWGTSNIGPYSSGAGVSQAIIDSNGDVFVSGRATPGAPSDMNPRIFTAKLSGLTGGVFWSQIYDPEGQILGTSQGIALAPEGDVVVAGATRLNNDPVRLGLLTIKYSGLSGSLVWKREKVVDGWFNYLSGVAVDNAGDVVVTGTIANHAQAAFPYNAYFARYAGATGGIVWEKVFVNPWDPANGGDQGRKVMFQPTGEAVAFGVANHASAVWNFTDEPLPSLAFDTPSVEVNEGSEAVITGSLLAASWNGNTPYVQVSSETGWPRVDPSNTQFTWSGWEPDGPVDHDVTVMVDDHVNPPASFKFHLKVNNVAPTIDLADSMQANANGFFDIGTTYFSDLGNLDTFTGTVDFGDGTGLHALQIDNATHSFPLWHQFPAGPHQYIAHITITDKDGGSGSDTFTVNVPALAPQITQQPEAITRQVGESATFTVGVSGTGPFTYQWRKDGVDIPGKTDSSLTFDHVQLTDDAGYSVYVLGEGGNITSNTAQLTVREAPGFKKHPESQTKLVGQPVTFFVEATGTPFPTLQWRFNGVDLPGETGSTFTINSVISVNAGLYSVAATNVVTITVSDAATLTVNAPPVFTAVPTNDTKLTGFPVNWSALVTGIPEPALQWRKNGVNIPGATGSSFSIASTTTADTGTYSIVASNSAGTVESSSWTLTVNVPPAFTTQPSSLTRNVGQSAQFSATATGTPNPTYQWKKDGVNIPGATGATFGIPVVFPGNAGSYTVTATNAAGSATSNAATLTVNIAPAFTSHPASQTKTVGESVTFSASASGSPNPTYQWRKNGVAIPGATGNSYTIPSVALADAGNYDVIATNAAGSATSNAAVLTVNPTTVAPMFTLQPVGKEVISGQSVVFSAIATGDPTPTYQWRRDGVNIPGATGSSLSIPSATTSDAGTYTVVAKNVAGSATSNAAVLTVAIVGAPAAGFGIGDLPGGAVFSQVRDATKIAGVIYAVGSSALLGLPNGDTGVLWSSTDGLVALPPVVVNTTGLSFITASAITPDANFIASRARNAPTGGSRTAVRVTRDGLVNLDLNNGTIPGFSAASAISNDGSILYGLANNLSQAVRFTAAGPTATLIPFMAPEHDTSAPAGRGTSADGSVMVGTSATLAVTGGNSVGPGNAAFRYVHGSGVSAIPMPAGGTWSGAMAVTPDGNLSLAYGNSTAAPNGGLYIHNATTDALTELGTPAAGWQPGNFGGFSSDGAIAVSPFADPNGSQRASFLHNSHGWHDVQTLIAAKGIDLTNWTSITALGISPDATLLFGSATHDGATEGWVVEFAPGDLAAYEGEPPATTIAGTWSIGNTGGTESSVLVLNDDGTYYFIEDHVGTSGGAAAQSGPHPVAAAVSNEAYGYEIGTYTWDPDTGAFTVTTLVDTNGTAGLSGINGLGGVTASMLGGTLTLNVPGPDGGDFTLANATGGSPITGAWIVGDPASPNTLSVVIFLDDGTYYLLSDGPDNDPSGQDGIEHGTYTWDPDTGALTATVIFDTNGEWGLSDNGGPLTVFVEGGTLVAGGPGGPLLAVSDSIPTFVAPVINEQPEGRSVTVGQSASFSVTAVGTLPFSYQWNKDGSPIPGATSATYSIASAQASDAAAYSVVVTNDAGSTSSNGAALAVTSSPVIGTQPGARSVVAGATVTFAATVSGPGPFAYQWRKNGSIIPGANGASLTLAGVTTTNAGNYTVMITNAYGSVTSSAAALSVGTDSRLVNLSARAYSGGGDATLILGFFISGSGSKTLVIRGIGPTLGDFISTPVVADPSIVVYSSSGPVATNNDWDSSLAGDFSVVGAFPLNAGGKDAALKLTLGPGSYTVHMLNPGPVAEGLIEVYDRSLDAGTRLTNLSCRLKIVQGQTVIVGTYLLGTGSNVVARNVGPGLSPYVLDTERPFLLPDPMLRYYDGVDSLIGENNDWDSILSADFGAVGAFPIATGGKDAAAKLALTPGRYSFHASGNSSGGVILVELYQAP